jgi:hypothetical protein
VDAFEFTQELKLSPAVLAGEGGGQFGKFGNGFAQFNKAQQLTTVARLF